MQNYIHKKHTLKFILKKSKKGIITIEYNVRWNESNCENKETLKTY